MLKIINFDKSNLVKNNRIELFNMNLSFKKEYTSIKRKRQIQLLECIYRVIDLYTEEYETVLPVEF